MNKKKIETLSDLIDETNRFISERTKQRETVGIYEDRCDICRLKFKEEVWVEPKSNLLCGICTNKYKRLGIIIEKEEE